MVGLAEDHQGGLSRLVRSLSLAIVVSLGTGCGAGAMLKGPIAGQCQSAGLKSCPELADGVVLFIEGDEAKAQEKLVAAAAANSPDDLSQFVCALKAIEMIPGAGDYMGPVLKVVEIIEQAKGKSKDGAAAEGDGPGEGRAGATGEGAAIAQCPSRSVAGKVLTAATDPSRLRTGVAAVEADGDGVRCGGQELGTFGCHRIRRGPFVVTDLQSSPGCTMVVLSGDPTDDGSRPSWAVGGHLSVHGARLLVDQESTLMVGVSGHEARGSCVLLWGGFEPYPRAGGLPEDL